MNLDDITALFVAHNYLGFAMLLIGYLTYLLSDQSKFPLTIDTNARWLRWLNGRDPKPVVVCLLGVTYGILADREAGHTWLDSLKLGLMAGVMTMGLFDVIVKFGFNGNVPMILKQLLLLFPKPQANAVLIPKPPGLPTAVNITADVAELHDRVTPLDLPKVPPGRPE